MSKTQLTAAREGRISREMKIVARKEGFEPEEIRKLLAAGKLVIPANKSHKSLAPVGIGAKLTTKINANIGNSQTSSCPTEELAKLEVCLRYGADAVMDLSTGANICEIRRNLIAKSPAPIGTVPIYECASEYENCDEIPAERIFEVIESQAEQGVDFMTIHAGLLRKHVPSAMRRLLKIVSRGGAIIASWMRANRKENPFYEGFDRILEICLRHDVTLSLGDGLRPGCIADASDKAQFAELGVLGELVRRCKKAGVQVMVEGPGHVPINEIEMNMRKERELCEGAPFYILGPLVCDCAPGYDHITGAIGGAMGAFYGAAMLCYVTPKEHLGLPDAEDVRNGIVAFKIAAHAADVALKKKNASLRDREISLARAQFDWEKQFSLALDPDRAREFRSAALGKMSAKSSASSSQSNYCTMCGPKFCSMKISAGIANKKAGN